MAGDTYAGGQLALGVGRDRLITVGDQEPGRQASAIGAEQVDRQRCLHR